MCLIFTIIASVFFALFYFGKNAKKNAMLKSALKTTTLAFVAAALMWCVDGVSSVIAGEAFFDLSANDAILGAIIIALGLAFFAICYFVEKCKMCKVEK